MAILKKAIETSLKGTTIDPLAKKPIHTVGKTIPYSESLAASNREGDTSDILLSSYAVVLSSLTQITAMQCKGNAVVRLKRPSGEECLCRFDGKGFRFSGKYDDLSAVAAMVAYVSANDNHFAEAFSEMQTKKFSDSQYCIMVYRYCDYLNHVRYYDGGVALLAFEVEENSLTKEEVEKALDSGLLGPVSGFAPIRAVAAKAKKAKDDDSFWTDCKNGRYVIPFDWSDDAKKAILPRTMLESFVPNKAFKQMITVLHPVLSRVVEKRDAEMDDGGIRASEILTNLILYGDPAGGKSITWRAVAATLGLPFYTVAGHKYTEEDIVEGKNKVVDGNLQYVKTDFLKCFEEGGIVVLEELNLWNPGVSMGVLGQAIEAPYVLMQNGYKATYRHPLCVVGANINIGTEGTTDLNEALQTRFRYALEVEAPTKDAFINIISGDKTYNKEAEWIYEFYAKITDWLRSDDVGGDDISSVVSLRSCQGAMQMIKLGMSPKDALKVGIVGHIVIRNKDLKDDLNDILDSYPDM